ncbi:MAG TPA: DinB family protein [Dehalococcoidia bacterium]|nr:DinB family protein [Dehalococcoidia bacterium]
MVVKLTDGREAVRAYVSGHAAQGVDHVTALVRDDRDSMRALIDDLSEAEGNVSVAPEEWSISQALQHMNSSFDRSIHRLIFLSTGRPFEWPAAAGGLSEGQPPTFSEARRAFLQGEQAVLDILEHMGEGSNLDVTYEHAFFGPFSWLQWAVYSHHVHTHDHLGQVGEARKLVLSQRR